MLIQNKALELSFFLSLPASVALMIGSNQIISALFGYGLFDQNSVINCANVLYFFSFGLPAFVMIKIFATFFFANQDTKTPFYISLLSVLINISISLYYFNTIGFIIIPIATTISSWFNAILLFIFLKNKNLFYFNKIFLVRFLKIIASSLLMGLFFNYLIFLFEHQLAFDSNLKSLFLILSVFLAMCFYLIVCYFMKAFKISDIQLKY